MQNVLTAIAKQAGLDRVLFTPAVKQLYFEMAVASGGVTQFKHADTTRNGLSYAADKADDKKRALLLCSYQELFVAYDHFIRIANDLLPVVILVIREEIRGQSKPNLSPLFLRDTGWVQFWSHTYQEAYDHIALGYLLHEEKIRLPVMVMQSAVDGGGRREFRTRDELNLGSPLKGLETSRVEKKMTFEEAFARMKQKKEPPSLPGSYQQLASALPELYAQLEYKATADSLPVIGRFQDAEAGILSLLPAPAEIERDGYEGDGTKCAFVRPLCYRPLSLAETVERLARLDAAAIVEPVTTPGVPQPPFFGEIVAMMPSSSSTRLLSVTIPTAKATLDKADVIDIVRRLKE